jgi:hypothetical protein
MLEVEVEVIQMEQVVMEDTHHSMVKKPTQVEEVVEEVVVPLVALEDGVEEEEEEELLLGVLEEDLGVMDFLEVAQVNNGEVEEVEVVALLELVVPLPGVGMVNIILK